MIKKNERDVKNLAFGENLDSLMYNHMILNLTILATVAGVLMALANYPQAIKIIKRKSSKDVSLLTFSIMLFGTIVWFIYGISIGNLPVIISYGIGLTGSSFVILAYFIYRGR